MKKLKLFTCFASITSLFACSQLKPIVRSSPSVTVNAIDNTLPVPTGTYFIINANGEALTPLNTGVGENVFLQGFTKSGVQKWQVTQHKTTKGISYTINLDGSDNLYLQPYAVKDHTPVIGPRGSSGTAFKIVSAASPKAWFIKSSFYNGDALRSFVFSPGMRTEMRFEAPENTDKFSWKLVPAASNE